MDSTDYQEPQGIITYVQQLRIRRINEKDIAKTPSVERLRRFILQDPIIKMQFQGAIDEIPQEVPSFQHYGRMRPGILHGSTIDEVMDLFNISVQTPPRFSKNPLCAIPFSVLRFDLANTQLGKAFFARTDVNDHLKSIFADYSAMLKSEKSLKHLNTEQGGWFSQPTLKFVNYNEIVCDQNAPHFGFKNWNDWFIRQFREDARPVDGINDPLVIVNSVQNFPLTGIDLPVLNVKANDKFWLKDTRYSLYDMFQAEKMGAKQIIDQSFVGGTVYQGFLTTWCYHRWHSPVSGVIERSYTLPGSYYLQNPSFDIKKTWNFKNSQPFLGHVAARQVFIINTCDEKIGRVAVIQIGMAEVSSCIPVVKEGDQVKKGEVIGRFELGGSSHVVIFDRRAKLQFNPKIFEREIKNGWEQSTLQKVNTWLAKVS